MEILKQESSTSCGIACIRSVMNNLGGKFSEEDIRKVHESLVSDSGNEINPPLSLGITALKLGYSVKYYTYSHIFFGNNRFSDLMENLEEKQRNYFGYGKYYVERAIEFLNLKGEFVLDKLGRDKLKSFIDDEEYPIVQIRTCFLSGKGNLGNRHKVIINKYDENGFYFLDPTSGEEKFVDYDTFYLAFYQEGPELLILGKK